MIKLSKDFRELIETLNKHEVRYMIIGGYAYSHYAQPRVTKDLDVWVAINHDNAEKTFRALAEFGAPLQGMSAEDFESKEEFFTFGDPPWRVDILSEIKGVEFDEAWKNKVTDFVENLPIHFINIDDLIKNKEKTGRGRDMDDAKDLKRVKKLLEEHGGDDT